METEDLPIIPKNISMTYQNSVDIRGFLTFKTKSAMGLSLIVELVIGRFVGISNQSSQKMNLIIKRAMKSH